MAVLLPNAQLTCHARAHTFARDAHGEPVAGADAPTVTGPFPGAVNILQGGEQSGFSLRIDKRSWPLRDKDEVHTGDGRVFILRGDPRKIEIPGYGAADYVSATADLDPPTSP